MVRPLRFLKSFDELKDRRRQNSSRHDFEDIVAISFAATICGCIGWSEIHEWAVDRKNWLQKRLKLPCGIPSEDTIARVISSINPVAFAKCFNSWTWSVFSASRGIFVAIDGKTLRGTSHAACPLHMLSAWCSQNQMIIGQIRTAEKSNEITAIPLLLDILDINGSIVTIDAMGCQKKIVKKIIELGGDYVLSLKGNQRNLHRYVKEALEKRIEQGLKFGKESSLETNDKGHGRIEIREYHLIDISELKLSLDLRSWLSLKSVGVVRSTRIVKGQKSVELRFFISSLNWTEIEKFSKAVRSHWSIENNLHWTLDVGLKDDQCRVQEKWGSENLATLKRGAHALLTKEKTCKRGVAM